MIGNPELRRNFWLELTLPRMILAPLVLGVIFYVVGIRAGVGLDTPAKYSFLGLAVVWGTRLAAASVFDELAQDTWDGQRMSAQSAATLVAGKLLGATVYAWYCGAIALAAFLYDGLRAGYDPAPVSEVVALTLLAVAAQAVALAAALMFLRRARGTVRRAVTAAQGVALAAAYILYSSVIYAPLGDGFRATDYWYGLATARMDFVLISLALFAVWAVVWCWRQMRIELQYDQWPWAWPLFLVFVVAYGAGFLSDAGRAAADYRTVVTLFTVAAFWLATYAALFAEPKDKVHLRLYARALAQRDGAALARRTPAWLIAFGMFLAAVLILAVDPNLQAAEQALNAFLQPFASWFGLPRSLRLAPVLVALALFVLRDIVLVLALNMGPSPRRADTLAVILLGVGYFILPGLTQVIEWAPGFDPSLIHMLIPWPDRNPLVVVVPVLVTLVPAVLLALHHWRRTLKALR